ncbi:MAG: GntP family permease [Chthoniobacteraceae bacterium]
MNPLLLLCCGMVIVVGGMLWLRLHPFLAMIVAAYSVAMLTPAARLRHFADARVAKHEITEAAAEKFADSAAATRVADEFGKTCASIGILIAMAGIIGEGLLVSGAAESIASAALRWTGASRAQWAFFLTSFLLGIPVFLATLFCLLLPMAKAMTKRTGRDYLLYILCIVAGGTITHSLVPPAPGPALVARQLGVNMGTMIFAGIIIGFGAALCGYAFARIVNRRLSFDLPVELEAKPDAENHPLPPLAISLAPVVLPLVLIGAHEFFKDDNRPFALVFQVLGHTDMALLLGAIAALLLVVRYRPREGTAKTMQTALAHAAMVVLITASGGAFGGALQQTGIAEEVGRLAGGAQALALPVVWLVTALVRTAQGSATVAMITAIPIAKAFLDAGSPIAAVYFAVAIGCGSKPIPWMNDGGFWVVAKMSGMTEKQTLRTMSPMMTLQGIAGLVITMLAAWVLPLTK